MTAPVTQGDARPRYPLDLPGTKERIARMVLDGKNDTQIAEAFDVHVSSVLRWRRRWATQLQEAIQNQEQALETYAISRKSWRIAKLQQMADGLDADLQQAGYTYTEETRHGQKIHAHPAAQELRATLQQTATELDQLPRAGVNITNQNVVIVKQVSGPEGGNPAL